MEELLSRLHGVIGLDTVETWHAELWLDDADSVAAHLRIWRTLRESAVFGVDAQRVISRALRAVEG